MDRVLAFKLAELLDLEATRSIFLFLRGRVVSTLALGAFQCNDFAHDLLPISLRAPLLKVKTGEERINALPRRETYARISSTVPEATVRPPSRMAKRCFCSIAIGAISSTVMVTLSPGMTISVPSGRVMIPVTSVVRK